MSFENSTSAVLFTPAKSSISSTLYPLISTSSLSFHESPILGKIKTLAVTIPTMNTKINIAIL